MAHILERKFNSTRRKEESFGSLLYDIAQLFKKSTLGAAAAVLGAVGVAKKAEGVVRPAGSNDADYLAKGMKVHESTGSLLFVHATIDGFSYVFNGVRVNSEWAMIPMHAYNFKTGIATIDWLSNGKNFITDPCDVRVPLEIKTTKTWDINRPFSSGPDVAFIRVDNMPGKDLVFAPVGSIEVGEAITAAGSGYHGTSSASLSPQDGNIRGFNAPVSAVNPSNVSDSMYFTIRFNPYTGLSTNGMGAFLDSGGLGIDAEGRAVGMISGGEGGTDGIGSTALLNFTDASNAALIKENTKATSSSLVKPDLGYLLTLSGMTVSWDSKAVGWTLQKSPDLSTWTNVGTTISSSGTFTYSGGDTRQFFRLFKP